MNCDECERHKEHTLINSTRVKELLAKLQENNKEALNLKITVSDCSGDNFLRNCRAYTANPPLEVVLCANSLKDRDEVEVSRKSVHGYILF